MSPGLSSIEEKGGGNPTCLSEEERTALLVQEGHDIFGGLLHVDHGLALVGLSHELLQGLSELFLPRAVEILGIIVLEKANGYSADHEK
jgi:hypothetical protein